MTTIGSNSFNNLTLKDGIKTADFQAKVKTALAEGPEGKGVITESELQELAKDLKDPKSLDGLVKDLVSGGAVFDDNAIASLKKSSEESVNPGVKNLFDQGLTAKKSIKDTNPLFDKLESADSKLAKRLEKLDIPKKEVEEFVTSGKISPKIKELFSEGAQKLSSPKEMWGKPWEKFNDTNATGLEVIAGLKTKLESEKKDLLTQKEKLKADPTKQKEFEVIDSKISEIDSKLKGANDVGKALTSANQANQKAWTGTVANDLNKGVGLADELCKKITAETDPAKKAGLEKQLAQINEKNAKLGKAIGVTVEAKKPEAPKAPEKKAEVKKPEAKPEAAKPSLLAPNGATEVDDAVVQKIIDQEEAYGKSMWVDNPKESASSAWKSAYDKRQKDVNDVNWAAAEHYLYAKYSGKSDGVAGAALTGFMATGYDAVKAGLFLIGAEKVISGDGSTPSKPTLGSTAWGLKGAKDGL